MAIRKKIGAGTVSLFLTGLAFACSYEWSDGSRVAGLGVSFLRAMGFGGFVSRNPNAPSLLGGIVALPAFFIGKKYNEHLGANAGRILSIVYLVVCLAALPWHCIHM